MLLVDRFVEALDSHARLFAEDTRRLRVPRPVGARRRLAGSPFHVYPELFLQISGITRFSLPAEQFTLGPGESCIIPRLLPHAERVGPAGGSKFRNLVMMISAEGFSFHFAGESPVRAHSPVVREAERYEDLRSSRVADMLDEIVELSLRAGTAPGRNASGRIVSEALRHSFLGLLYGLVVMLRESSPIVGKGHPTIVTTRKQIAIYLSDPELSVSTLAEWSGCSADYLSYLFHRETGETLIAYINRKRISMAQSLLANGGLNVSEIAWACGFSDPAYFCRVFRKYTGTTPGGYRSGATGIQEPLSARRGSSTRRR